MKAQTNLRSLPDALDYWEQDFVSLGLRPTKFFTEKPVRKVGVKKARDVQSNQDILAKSIKVR